MFGPKQAHFTFTTAPFLVQHLVCRVCEKQNNTHITITTLGCLFSQGISPSPQVAARWRQAAARCDTASGHSVIWSQENKCWMQEASLIKLLLPRTPLTFGWSASLPWQSNTFKSEPQKRFAYLHSSTAKKKVGSMKCFFIFCHYNSTTLIPGDPAAKNRSVRNKITEIQKKWRVKRRKKTT